MQERIFEHVIVVLNTGNVMTAWTDETIDGIDACLLAGYTGQYAARCTAGNHCGGDVNPEWTYSGYMGL